MKRSLILTLALSLAAALAYSSLSSAQSSTPVRGSTVLVTIKVTPKRDRTRPFTFTTTGRIVPPGRFCAPGVAPSSGAGNCVPIRCPPGARDARYCQRPGVGVICSGIVAVRFQSRGSTISSRNVRVRPNCTYRSRVTFRTRLKLRNGRLAVRARFQGNSVLRAKTSATRPVRAG